MANANSQVEEISGSENLAYFEAAQAELVRQRRELAKQIARLYTEFPGVRWVGSLDFEGLPIIGVLARNSCVHEPMLSECGRFTVEPSYYGLSEEAAAALQKANHALSVGNSGRLAH
jgi:hypothetical protein